MSKQKKPSIREQKRLLRVEWETRLLEKVKLVHKRNLTTVVSRILKRIDTSKNSIVSRSKKHGVPCPVTVEELRQLVYDAYGSKCKYCDKLITIKTMAFDHIIPISKGGDSSKENLQVICKTSNTMKGSLDESNFLLVLEWLETVSDELRTDISIRLSRGIR